ncbi:hypothetical protein [Actinoplanes sp. ATCC 53533]|uniref:hypothetical protein n=1 Tax=Actinoplanes sp. ATCC 53533 TaxID=1288362 RepID=UPI000F7B41B9|nr:hypothetical protein [Actinoplanes sp. ATCC 53533]
MALQPILRGVALRCASQDEQDDLGARFGISQDDREYIYIVASGTPANFVVSGQPSWRQADRAVDDPSLFDFGQPWPPVDEMEWGSID